MPRSKGYDPNVARDRALGAFWKHGYRATSVGDLEKAMGVNRFAIQTFFGGKEALYESCLDAYLTGTEDDYFTGIRSGGLTAIESFFRMLSTPSEVLPEAAWGCLLVNSLSERADPGAPRVRRQTKRYLKGLKKAFQGALQTATRDGELRLGLNHEECADFLVSLVLGIHLVNRSAGSVAASDPVAAVLRDVLASWRA